MVRRIVVVPHDPHWVDLYCAEVERLAGILGEEIVATHHIGSTAIPGISAKPIIDILVEVRDIERIDDYNPALIALGYIPEGENGIPGRRFFILGSEESRTHHVHMFQAGDLQVARHLRFRDYMIAHRAEALAYSQLKIGLAARFPLDADSYVAGKDSFIKEIDRRAAEESQSPTPQPRTRGWRA